MINCQMLLLQRLHNKLGEDHLWTQQFKYLLTTSGFLLIFNFMGPNSKSVESAEGLTFYKSEVPYRNKEFTTEWKHG